MSNLIPFQWSKKLDDGTIYMVQAETADELMLAKTEIEAKFLNVSIAHLPGTPIQEPQIPARTNATKYNCDTCGAEATLRKGVSEKTDDLGRECFVV